MVRSPSSRSERLLGPAKTPTPSTPSNPSPPSTMFAVSATTVSQFLYICLFALPGNLLRILLGQWFGAACEAASYDGGNSTSASFGNPDVFPCVTSAGSALFLDLPANMLGSLLMGLLLGSRSLHGAAIDLPLAVASRRGGLQSRTDLHLGLRTGLCGSLTTFSGWNAQMVLLMVGADGETGIHDAIFGYLIGLTAALASFAAGEHAATAIFRWRNGEGISREMEVLLGNAAVSLVINSDLADFDRRFLADVANPEDLEPVQAFLTPAVVDYLRFWRSSTDADRWVVGGANVVQNELKKVETAILVDHLALSDDLSLFVAEQGWDLRSLKQYAIARAKRLRDPTTADAEEGARDLLRPSPKYQGRHGHGHLGGPALLLFLAYGLLVYGTISARGLTLFRLAYLSSLFAPAGASLRWLLSRYNGALSGSRRWFFLGTFAANVLAAAISLLAYGLELRQGREEEEEVGTVLLLSAVKVGLAGCLSTVSTFVAEIDGLLAQPVRWRAYLYAALSLGTAGALGTAVYYILLYL
uniref:Fluoride ion transporter CrcB n=2 Tax=Corethron hystrix TaxID=216773 RepID=A0A7S1BZG2_9STRA|mmetsp:Transcript_8024/g.17442  ORF Transcript_8024/g.17442 Transcript_8024/m.17442 type:complete len:529 (+) Transcript_8024:294-1880(+)